MVACTNTVMIAHDSVAKFYPRAHVGFLASPFILIALPRPAGKLYQPECHFGGVRFRALWHAGKLSSPAAVPTEDVVVAAGRYSQSGTSLSSKASRTLESLGRATRHGHRGGQNVHRQTEKTYTRHPSWFIWTTSLD